jgi:hypothetical protein
MPYEAFVIFRTSGTSSPQPSSLVSTRLSREGGGLLGGFPPYKNTGLTGPVSIYKLLPEVRVLTMRSRGRRKSGEFERL